MCLEPGRPHGTDRFDQRIEGHQQPATTVEVGPEGRDLGLGVGPGRSDDGEHIGVVRDLAREQDRVRGLHVLAFEGLVENRRLRSVGASTRAAQGRFAVTGDEVDLRHIGRHQRQDRRGELLLALECAHRRPLAVLHARIVHLRHLVGGDVLGAITEDEDHGVGHLDAELLGQLGGFERFPFGIDVLDRDLVRRRLVALEQLLNLVDTSRFAGS